MAYGARVSKTPSRSEANQAFWPSDAAIVDVSCFSAMITFDEEFRQTQPADHRFLAPPSLVSTAIPDTRVARDSPSLECRPAAGYRTRRRRRALFRSRAGTTRRDAPPGGPWGSPRRRSI